MRYYQVGQIHDSRAYVKSKPPTIASKTSVGLGDIVEKVIGWTGLDKIVDKKKCGCAKRKEMLNNLLKF